MSVGAYYAPAANAQAVGQCCGAGQYLATTQPVGALSFDDIKKYASFATPSLTVGTIVWAGIFAGAGYLVGRKTGAPVATAVATSAASLIGFPMIGMVLATAFAARKM
jgi:hypothetical protein